MHTYIFRTPDRLLTSLIRRARFSLYKAILTETVRVICGDVNEGVGRNDWFAVSDQIVQNFLCGNFYILCTQHISQKRKNVIMREYST